MYKPTIINYLRYIIVAILLSSFFYAWTFTIKEERILKTIEKKLPLIIDKKGFLITIDDMKIMNISNGVMESEILANVTMNSSSKIGKIFKKYIDKSMKLTILTKIIPKVNNSSLSFELLSLDINHIIKLKEVKGILKERIENMKIPIKKMEKLSWLTSVKGVLFKENGDLEVYVMINRWILFLLIPIFLLREIGLLFISIYQKFISPRKKYKCAKGELYQNGTCSSTTKEAFKKHGFLAGMREYKKSTKACRKAYNKMKNRENKNNDVCGEAFCSGCSGSCGGDGAASSVGICELGSCG